MNDTITLYSLPECDKCNEIKGAFKRHSVEYIEINDRNEMKFMGFTSVPVLKIGDIVLQDYNEILNWLEQNNIMNKSKISIEDWLGINNQLGIDIWNKKYRRDYESFDEWLDRVSGGDDNVKQLILDKKFLFGGRILSNRGVSTDNEKTTYSNCYVITPPEDNIESIYETCGKLARTYSYGGGCGLDISKLAPAGAKVHNQAKSTSGAVSFMDSFNQVTEQIGQNGRRGALMLSISCDHPDLEKFITVKSDLNKVTSANISVRITDDFMKAVENDLDWELRYERPETGEIISKIVKAKDIYHLLCKNNWDYAEPGMLFWDKITGYNLLNNNDEFKYAGTNPCAEEPLPAGGSCLLGAINLAAFVTEEKKFNWLCFNSTVSIAVKALNEVLDEGLPKHPLAEQRETVRDWRQIGLGIMGIADMLIKMGIRYGSKESIELCDRIGGELACMALSESSSLSLINNKSYPRFDERVIESKFFKYHSNENLTECVRRHGLYNSQLLTIAPTGSISTMIGVSGGIEPIFANSYTRTTKSLHGHDETYKVYTPIVDKYMKENNINDEAELPDYFVTSSNIPINERIAMQSVWQKHIDASISSTINLPHEATIEDVEQLYMDAWKAGLKGVTVYRAGCAREGILVVEANAEQKVDNNDSSTLKRGDWKALAKDTVYYKKKLKIGCGDLKLFIGWSDSEKAIQDIYVKKSGSGGCERLSESTAIAMSAALRLGGSIDNIDKAFRGIGACPSFSAARAKGRELSKGNSCGSAILNAMREFIIEKNTSETKKSLPVTIHSSSSSICPECGAELRYEGGCNSCPNCGWSKCN